MLLFCEMLASFGAFTQSLLRIFQLIYKLLKISQSYPKLILGMLICFQAYDLFAKS